MTHYEEIRDKIRTGDIVLFSGKGKISHGIKMFTKSKWSHVGMALRMPEYDAIFIWESTPLSSLKDAIDERAKHGAQLVLLSERLRMYDGEVAIRHLIGIDLDEDPEARKKLMELRKEVRNRSYEEDLIEFMKAAYDGPWGDNVEDLSSLFCSELVAEAYQRIGLLPKPPEGIPANEYTPKDFSEQKTLNLLRNASLSIELPIIL